MPFFVSFRFLLFEFVQPRSDLDVSTCQRRVEKLNGTAHSDDRGMFFPVSVILPEITVRVDRFALSERPAVCSLRSAVCLPLLFEAVLPVEFH